MNFEKLFLQSGLHWQGSVGGFSLFYILGKTNIYKGVVTGRIEGFQQDVAIWSINNSSHTLREFAFNIHLGVKYGRIFYRFNTIYQDFGPIDHVSNNHSTVGLSLNFDEIYHSVKTSKLKFEKLKFWKRKNKKD